MRLVLVAVRMMVILIINEEDDDEKVGIMSGRSFITCYEVLVAGRMYDDDN